MYIYIYIYVCVCVYSVMVIVIGNGHRDPNSNLCHIINSLRKSMLSTIVLQSMDKLKGRLGSLTLTWQPVLEKEN